MYAIAIDGPSSSGKSSMASKVAKRLGILHLNTGRMYRALGLYAHSNGLLGKLNTDSTVVVVKEEVDNIINNAKIDIKFIDGEQHTFLNGEDVSDKLNSTVVSDYSSRVSVIPEIRDYVVLIQREIATKTNLVMEGRDITSHVLPNAKYKFFINAPVEVRAERRLKELTEKGFNYTYEEILEDLKQRDYRDINRTYCPLIKVDDAIELDTSNNTLDEMVDIMLSYIKE